MATSYTNFQGANINSQLQVLSSKVQAIYTSMNLNSLSAVFQSAISGGYDGGEEIISALAEADQEDLKAAFNSASVQELGGVLVVGGQNNVKVTVAGTNSHFNRQRVLNKLFNLKAQAANRRPATIKSDIEVLASLLTAIDVLNQQKALLNLGLKTRAFAA
jgi:hypothetical protein